VSRRTVKLPPWIIDRAEWLRGPRARHLESIDQRNVPVREREKKKREYLEEEYEKEWLKKQARNEYTIKWMKEQYDEEERQGALYYDPYIEEGPPFPTTLHAPEPLAISEARLGNLVPLRKQLREAADQLAPPLQNVLRALEQKLPELFRQLPERQPGESEVEYLRRVERPKRGRGHPAKTDLQKQLENDLTMDTAFVMQLWTWWGAPGEPRIKPRDAQECAEEYWRQHVTGKPTGLTVYWRVHHNSGPKDRAKARAKPRGK
jgi:hypothetical protein